MPRLNKIENIAQLRMEIVRLKLLQAEQEELIQKDIQGLKKSFAIGAATYSASFLIQKLFFKNSSPIMKAAVSLLMGGAGSFFASGKAGPLFERIKELVKEKFGKKKNASEAFDFDEHRIYE
jgi:hypothetical protein